MPSVLIFGGSGKVAQHLTKLLTSSNPPHTVYSIVRSHSHDQDLKSIGATPVIQDIEDGSVEEFAATITKYKPDAIVWSAGAGGKGDPSRTEAVDWHGAVKSFDAAAKSGVKRFVIVSAIDVRDKAKPAPSWYTEDDIKKSEKGWDAIGRYMKAKLEADKDLVTKNDKRGLEYTIVRPGALKDDSATGKFRAGKLSLGGSINREDVGTVIYEVLKNKSTKGLVFDVVNGDDSVEDAVKQVVDQKINTFEGQY